jgi:hypothetical protein
MYPSFWISFQEFVNQADEVARLCAASRGFHRPVSLKKMIALDFDNDHWMTRKKFWVATTELANTCLGANHWISRSLADSRPQL